MAISNHRKLFHPPIESNKTESYCYMICSPKCTLTCFALSPSPLLPLLPPPPPLLLPPNPPINQEPKHHISSLVIIMAGVLGAAFFVLAYFLIMAKFCSFCNRSRRRSPAQVDHTGDDFLDENHGPVIDNPFWYINTVGLDQSVINSIAMFKYKKGEGMVEGTECSVCLGEFSEDETLRLLPKCSHAFHLQCIDTWLRSHTNCPLCRARIVSNSNAVGSTSTATAVLNSSHEEESRMENSESDSRLEGDQSREDEVRVDEEELRERRRIKSEIRVLSDLADNLRALESGLQPVRRSVSMDFSSASIFCFSVANSEGPSATQLEIGDKINHRRSGVNPILFRLKGTSPISMKRSVSSGGKISSSRHSRNRSSLLPL